MKIRQTVTFERVIKTLQEWTNNGAQLGAQLSVSEFGDVLLDTSVGNSTPAEPLTTTGKLPWLCCAKPLLAIAVLQLQQCGEIDIDMPIAAHLPQLAGTQLGESTPAHVMTHTVAFQFELSRSLLARPSEEVLAALAQIPITHSSGQKAFYSNWMNWYLLSEIIERISGKGLSDFLQEHIVSPLNLFDTLVDSQSKLPRDYEHRRLSMFDTSNSKRNASNGAERLIWNCFKPGVGVWGAAHDLRRVFDALMMPDLAGGTAVNVDLASRLTATHRSGLTDRRYGGNNHTLKWGYGVVCDEQAMPWAPTTKLVSHRALESSFALADFQHCITVVCLTNGMPGFLEDRRRQRSIIKALVDDLTEGGRFC